MRLCSPAFVQGRGGIDIAHGIYNRVDSSQTRCDASATLRSSPSRCWNLSEYAVQLPYPSRRMLNRDFPRHPSDASPMRPFDSGSSPKFQATPAHALHRRRIGTGRGRTSDARLTITIQLSWATRRVRCVMRPRLWRQRRRSRCPVRTTFFACSGCYSGVPGL